jgi:dolichyl-diphosphooligosaccharide--protein glycosyltransferase
MHLPENKEKKDILSLEQFLAVLFFVFLLLAGFFIRVDNLFSWNLFPDLFFADNEPVLVNLDGYYYLSLARDLLDGTYTAMDVHRAIPDAFTKPSPPPLLSVVLAGIASTGLFSLNWIAQFIAPILGLLVTVPLFFFCRRWGGVLMLFPATALVLLAPNYVSRSWMGMLDTDCLNVFFALSCACCALYFGIVKDRRRYFFLAGCLVFFMLFLWWWDQAPSAVVGLSLGPLLISAFMFYRPRGRERVVALCVVLGVLGAVLLWQGFDYPLQLWQQIAGSFSYISKQQYLRYPNIGITINEQAKPSWDMFILLSASYAPMFYLSLAGLVWLVVDKRREVLVLLPIAVVGGLSLFSVRFTIFLSPVLGLGLGYLCSALSRYVSGKQVVLYTVVVVALLLVFIQQTFKFPPVNNPMYPGYIIQGMQRLPQVTPDDAVVWSWWDEGHPLIYWAGRATVNDGMVHSGKRTHFTALPLASRSFRLSANFMQFYAVRGMKGIDFFYKNFAGNIDEGDAVLRRILSVGPEAAKGLLDDLHLQPAVLDGKTMDWLEFFYPMNPRPMYLFLDDNLMKITENIYWFGTWKVGEHEGGKTLPTFSFYYSSLDSEKVLSDSGAVFNFKKGEARLSAFKGTVPIVETAVTDFSGTNFISPPLPVRPQSSRLTFADTFLLPKNRLHTVSLQGMYELEIFKPAKYAVFQDTRLAETVMNRLFWRKDDFDKNYFTPVELNTPAFQIWRVTGDRRSDNGRSTDLQHSN